MIKAICSWLQTFRPSNPGGNANIAQKHVNHHCDISVAFVMFTLLSFVKFQVQLLNFDGMTKGLAVISNF